MSSTTSRGPAAATAAALLLVAGCGSAEGCTPTPATTGACPDLMFRGHGYDEWREIDPVGILQEIGNATYPACNATETCAPDDLEGFGATDVWLLEGTEVTDAVLGLREGTHTYVIFVRVGVDPADLRDPDKV